MLVDAMLSTIDRHGMLARGERVLVALSGGPDSVALLFALWSVRKRFGIHLYAAHLNHSIRGAAADADAEYAAQFAASLGVPCTVEKIDVPEVRAVTRTSMEEAARMVRYEFLIRTAENVGADRIALGHNADDQAETVLLNILRGTGVDGLSGIPPVRGIFIRPLIDIRRFEIEEYVALHGLHPRIDATNLAPEYTRNKVRLELLPLLRAEYNSEIDSGLLRLAELSREDSAYLNKEAESALVSVTARRTDRSIGLDARGLLACPLPIQRRVVRGAVRAVRGEISDLGYLHVESVLRLLSGGGDFTLDLPAGIVAERIGGTLSFASERSPDVEVSYSHNLLVPGRTPVPEIGVAIETEVFAGPIDYVRPRGSMEVVLDYQALCGDLVVRSWQPGDRIRPLGLRGTKKVQDIFVDHRIPRRERARVPLLTDGEKVLWVAGISVSDEAKIRPSTRESLLVRVVQI